MLICKIQTAAVQKLDSLKQEKSNHFVRIKSNELASSKCKKYDKVINTSPFPYINIQI